MQTLFDFDTEVSTPAPAPAPAPARPEPVAPRYHLTHVPALDGLRGVGIATTIFFHVKWMTGGYLSMALFFALSGFLITTLLLEEHIKTDGIRLKKFYGRRARRLLPALLVFLVGVGIYAHFFAATTEVTRLRGDTFATLLYVANWHSIIAKQGYWDLFSSPSILQHTWSLAIEEQFYALWPLVILGVLSWRRGSLRVLLWGCVGVALAGAVWMAVVYDPRDVSRAYLGTDTRMPALLLGAALAVWLQVKGPVRTERARRALERVAMASCVLLTAAFLWLPGKNPFVYRGGLFLCGAAGTAVVMAVTHPQAGPVARMLSWRPLCWLGLISYGLYLWHWPVIVVLNRSRTHLSGVPLALLQITVSVLIAVASYVFLEQPIRHRGLNAWRRRSVVPVGAFVCIGMTAFLVTVPRPASAEERAAAAVRGQDVAKLASVVETPLPLEQTPPVAVAQPFSIKPGQPLPRPLLREPRLLVVGDSVSLSLAMAMQEEPARWKEKVAIRSVVGCSLDSVSGLTRDGSGEEQQEHPTCQRWPQRWQSDVTRFKPDAVLVAFGGLQTNPRRLPDGGWHKPCDPEYLTWFRGEWDRALKVLSSAGAIVYVAPGAYIDMPDMYPDINEGFDCINPVVRAAVAANPRARLIPLDTWVCPAADACRDEENGYRLRFDGLHYAGEGAGVANQWIQSQIFVPPKK